MTDDLVKRLNEDFSVNAREDIQHQMKVYEAERKEAADRIEKLEAALRLIAQNNYGLQSMIEDGTDTPEARAEYYAGQVIRRQNIARAALGEKKDD
jgi:hypothetical protein